MEWQVLGLAIATMVFALVVGVLLRKPARKLVRFLYENPRVVKFLIAVVIVLLIVILVLISRSR